MSAAVSAISDVVYAKWAFAGAGSAIDMPQRLLRAAPDRHAAYDGFFDLAASTGLLVLAGFTAVFLAVTLRLLRRAARRPA
jgi:hypothetical protein